MNKFSGVFPLILLFFSFLHAGTNQYFSYQSPEILQQDITVSIIGPGTMPLKGMGTGLYAIVSPDNIEGTYDWEIVIGRDKVEIEYEEGPWVWIKPIEVSDTSKDIVVMVEFSPIDPLMEPVYDFIWMTVFDVEIVNGEDIYSETPIETEFFAGEKKVYKAKVKPDDFRWDYCEWVYPEWIPWTRYEPETEYCYVYGVLPGYGTLEVHIRKEDSFEPAVDGISFGIYSANIRINGKGEDKEEGTGIYIEKGKMVQVEIGPSMKEIGSPEFVEMTGPGEIHFKIEPVEKGEKISLWEYDDVTNTYIQRQFPYTYSCTPSQQNPFLSKTNLYIKGEQVSESNQDIKLILKGYKLSERETTAVDTVIITVFRIDVKLADMDEGVEDQTGLYLRLNDDDDDSDTEIDNQDNKVIGEDDLVRLEISCEPGDLPGNFTLSWGNNIKLWERTEKETEITQSQYTSEQLPETCYVEGYNVSNTIKDTEIKLSYQAPDDTQAEDKAKITVYAVELTGPQDVVVGEQFGLTITLSPPINTNATISRVKGTSYNETYRTEKYWNGSGDLLTTDTYIHRFGIKLPEPPTIGFVNSVSILITQYSLEDFSLKVEIDAFGGAIKNYVATKEHVWMRVKSTYFRTDFEDEGVDWPGYFFNNLPRVALPYGVPSLMNTYVILTEDISSDTKVEAKVRDRGPWFPFGSYYPKDNNWYNDYWDDAGWKHLAGFMVGLIRAGDTKYYSINGAGIDLSEGSIKGLRGQNYNPNNWPNPHIYWRFK